MWQLRSIISGLRRFSQATIFKSKSNVKSIQEVTRHANHIAQLLQESKFSALRSLFAWPLRWLVTETLLKKGWVVTQLMTGPLVKVEPAKVRSGWLFTIAEVPIEFKNMRLSMRLTMTGSNRLVGLKFGPAPALDPAQTWRCPPYANLNAFYESDIEIGSKYQVRGTLSLPRGEGQHPCVILLSGSGPCDRDSTVGAIKPFKDLAYGLASQGIAVLRFDKVTYSHPKKLKNSEITIFDEYMNHATAAINYARENEAIDECQIYVIGHSLGAVVAPTLVAQMPAIVGTILMAPPARPIYRAAIEQMQYLGRLHQSDSAVIDEGLATLKKQADNADRTDLSPNTPAKSLPFGIGAPYWLSLRQMKPIDKIKALQKRVLILHGGRDYQVTDADFTEWTSALQDAPYASLRRYPSLNHAFIAGDDLSRPSDYDRFANLDVSVISDIAGWLASPHDFVLDRR